MNLVRSLNGFGFMRNQLHHRFLKRELITNAERGSARFIYHVLAKIIK